MTAHKYTKNARAKRPFSLLRLLAIAGVCRRVPVAASSPPQWYANGMAVGDPWSGCGVVDDFDVAVVDDYRGAVCGEAGRQGYAGGDLSDLPGGGIHAPEPRMTVSDAGHDHDGLVGAHVDAEGVGEPVDDLRHGAGVLVEAVQPPVLDLVGWEVFGYEEQLVPTGCHARVGGAPGLSAPRGGQRRARLMGPIRRQV